MIDRHVWNKPHSNGHAKIMPETFSGKKPSPSANDFMTPLWLKKMWEDLGSERAQRLCKADDLALMWGTQAKRPDVRDTSVILVLL